ncbi:MAG: TlpA family protein disulfide reductase [Acidobacteriaceae bacterium]|nr:TlpA family protein disulfide reductase [Acidobacteriaceae bacterium]
MMRLVLVMLMAAGLAPAQLVTAVRGALAAKDFAGGERVLEAYRKQNGVTPEYVEAYSWLGRGAQANKLWDKAAGYSAETRRLVQGELKKRALDAETSVPLALGAAIEVEGHTLAATGRLSEALAMLNRELKTYYTTSIRTRIQKNIHLLSLVGKPAPALDVARFLLGPKLPALGGLKGKPVVLFFWAHWCSDCKQQGPVLTELKAKYPALQIVAPTQTYGYVANGEDATPAVEVPYIEKVRAQYYPDLTRVPAPLSNENFKLYGSSTSPTLVLIDKAGVVRMYHPGKMTAAELIPEIEKVL